MSPHCMHNMLKNICNVVFVGSFFVFVHWNSVPNNNKHTIFYIKKIKWNLISFLILKFHETNTCGCMHACDSIKEQKTPSFIFIIFLALALTSNVSVCYYYTPHNKRMPLKLLLLAYGFAKAFTNVRFGRKPENCFLSQTCKKICTIGIQYVLRDVQINTET